MNFQLAAVAVLILIVAIKYGNLSFTKTLISDDDVLSLHLILAKMLCIF